MAIIDQTYLTNVGGPTVSSGVLDALSAEIVSYLGHNVEEATYIQWIDGQGAPYVVVDEWPVTRIYFAAVGKRQVAEIKYTGTGVASVEILSDRIDVYSGDHTTNLTFGHYATISAMVTAINDISDWTCTKVTGVDGDLPSNYMFPMFLNFGQQDARVIQFLYGPDDSLDLVPDYSTNRHLLSPTGVSGNGFIQAGFDYMTPQRAAVPVGEIPEGKRNVLVHYKAGWASDEIPETLKSVCARMASDYVTASQTSGSLKSVKIGDYSHTMADVSSTIRGFADRYAGDLSQFANVEL